VIGALVATTLSTAELADQPPLSFVSVAAFLLFVYFACRFECYDGDNAQANHTGAIAAWSGRARIGITTVRSVRAASQNRFAVCCDQSRGSSVDEIQQTGSVRPAGVFRGGGVAIAICRAVHPGPSGLSPRCACGRGCAGRLNISVSDCKHLRSLRQGLAPTFTGGRRRGFRNGPLFNPSNPPGVLQLVPRNTLRIWAKSAVLLATGTVGERLMKRRHEFYLDAEVSERLATMAAKPGSSATAIMADALKAYFDRAASTELDERFRARLDKLSIQLGRLEHDQQIVAEALAVLARFQFSVTAPLSASDQAARSVAQDRFKAFIEQVSRRISSGRGLIEQVVELRSPSETNARSV
jgi:hypothetical protein